MNHAIAPGVIPPVPGLDKEEPELFNEADVPSDDADPSDDGEPLASDETAPEQRPLREVERE